MTRRDSSGRKELALPARVTAAAAAGDPAHVVALLREHGCVRVDRVLSRALAIELHAHSASGLASALARVKSGAVRAASVFAQHLLAGEQCGKRLDVKLDPADALIGRAIGAALDGLYGVYGAALGADAQLFELSAITSTEGTPQQMPHADFACWPTRRAAGNDGAASNCRHGAASDAQSGAVKAAGDHNATELQSGDGAAGDGDGAAGDGDGAADYHGGGSAMGMCMYGGGSATGMHVGGSVCATGQHGDHAMPIYDEVGPMVLVLFVALDDLEPRLGPTSFLPGTPTHP
jgi:hypothetical protein